MISVIVPSGANDLDRPDDGDLHQRAWTLADTIRAADPADTDFLRGLISRLVSVCDLLLASAQLLGLYCVADFIDLDALPNGVREDAAMLDTRSALLNTLAEGRS